MGVIINPRGTSGAGKTELVRRILSTYGWEISGNVEAVYREGRPRPIAYRVRHPFGGRPLLVLGHYEATCGGCDTIPLRDGGMDEAFRLARAHAESGHDVLLEGLHLSGEYRRSVALAKAHDLHVLRLETPFDRCVGNLIARRRAGRNSWAPISRKVAAEREIVAEACDRLQWCAKVEGVDFDRALSRAREILGVEGYPVPMPEAKDGSRRPPSGGGARTWASRSRRYPCRSDGVP